MIRLNKSKEQDQLKLRVLDLFCGAGGFSEGFRQGGYQIVAGIEKDPMALKTYAKNFPEAMAISKDLSTDYSSQNGILDSLKREKIDIIIGGPPCQGFSVAGKRLRDDPRNVLYRAYLDLIEHIKPKGLVVENVPTIMSLYNGEVARNIVEDFQRLGYDTSVFILLASDYGVPQRRRRVFFIGLKTKKSFVMPQPTTAFKPVTTEMAISDLPSLEDSSGEEETAYPGLPRNNYQKSMRKGARKLFNHWAVIHNQKTVDIVKLVPDGGNYKDLPEHLRNTRRVNIAWTRMNSQQPCFTIDAGHNHHFHYKYNRVPTVRECARIQSFPDRFRFWGNKTSQFRQVGNAVPPLLARAIAFALKEAFR